MSEMIENNDFMEAEDWRTMYLILNHAICDAIELVYSAPAAETAMILIKGLMLAEEYYVTVDDAVRGREERDPLVRATNEAWLSHIREEIEKEAEEESPLK